MICTEEQAKGKWCLCGVADKCQGSTCMGWVEVVKDKHKCAYCELTPQMNLGGTRCGGNPKGQDHEWTIVEVATGKGRCGLAKP